MNSNSRGITILVADDDQEDCLLVRDAWRENRLANTLRFVADGAELLDYLRRQGQYTDPAESPRPGLILLDLNMPRKDGREALGEIKAEPDLRQIPIVVLTASQTEEDIFRSYDLGVNSYVTKPVTFAALVEIIKTLDDYWFKIVELPGDCAPGPG